MRRFAALLFLVALSGCTPARAQSAWSEAALDDLEAVAAAAPSEGLPDEGAALA